MSAVNDIAVVAILGILTGIALAFVGALLTPEPADDEDEDEESDLQERVRLDMATRTGRRV